MYTWCTYMYFIYIYIWMCLCMWHGLGRKFKSPSFSKHVELPLAKVCGSKTGFLERDKVDAVLAKLTEGGSGWPWSSDIISIRSSVLGFYGLPLFLRIVVVLLLLSFHDSYWCYCYAESCDDVVRFELWLRLGLGVSPSLLLQPWLQW